MDVPPCFLHVQVHPQWITWESTHRCASITWLSWSWHGMAWHGMALGWMVTIGHRSSKSTFGANRFTNRKLNVQMHMMYVQWMCNLWGLLPLARTTGPQRLWLGLQGRARPTCSLEKGYLYQLRKQMWLLRVLLMFVFFVVAGNALIS